MTIWDSGHKKVHNTGIKLAPFTVCVDSGDSKAPTATSAPECPCMRDEGFIGSRIQLDHGGSSAQGVPGRMYMHKHKHGDQRSLWSRRRSFSVGGDAMQQVVVSRWQEASWDSINEPHQEAKSPGKL